MKVVPGNTAHLDLLEIRPSEVAAMALDPHAVQKMKLWIETSFSGTLLYNGVVLAMLGFFEIWPGVIEVWVLPSIYVPQHPIPFLRTVRRYIDSIVRDFNPHRLQSAAIDDELHEKWMTFLGFEKEGVLRQYSTDRINYCQWSKVRTEG